METRLDYRRILVFLGLVFGLAWISALVVYLTGGLSNSHEIGSGVTVAMILIPIPYLWAPAIAAILTRWLTHEGWKDLGLHLHLGSSWRYWIMGWLLPAGLALVGAVVFYLVFPQFFDLSLTTVNQNMLSSSGTSVDWNQAIIAILIGIAFTPIIHGLGILGEGYGWLGYFFPHLRPASWRKSAILLGLAWGVWYLPLILMGDQYGSAYPGFPWIGAVLFIWIMVCYAMFLAWLTWRSRTSWPGIVGRAAINGTAALSVLVLLGKPNPLLGPYTNGIIGGMGFSVLAVILFLWPGKRD
jgi:uncharacterized protein